MRELCSTINFITNCTKNQYIFIFFSFFISAATFYLCGNKNERHGVPLVFVDASVHDETNQKLKLKPDSIRDA